MDDSRAPFLIIEKTYWHLEELQVSCTLVLNFVTLLFCSYIFFPCSRNDITASNSFGLLNTDFSDADIEQLTDIRNIKIDKNLSQEKRQAQFLKQVGNPYLLRRGSMIIKVSFANNGLSMEQAFENLLLNV